MKERFSHIPYTSHYRRGLDVWFRKTSILISIMTKIWTPTLKYSFSSTVVLQLIVTAWGASQKRKTNPWDQSLLYSLPEQITINCNRRAKIMRVLFSKVTKLYPVWSRGPLANGPRAAYLIPLFKILCMSQIGNIFSLKWHFRYDQLYLERPLFVLKSYLTFVLKNATI